jgi:hypothetical protein
MVASRIDTTEDLLARLTTAAYSVVLRHGLKAPFIDVELALWRELRAQLSPELAARDAAAVSWRPESYCPSLASR